MYIAVIVILGIWILAGTFLHILYRRFYNQQGEKLFYYRAQIDNWEKAGYKGQDLTVLRKRIEKIIKGQVDYEDVLKKALQRFYKRVLKRIYYKFVKRLAYWIYYRVIKKSGKIVIFATVLLNLAITLSAVGLLITKDVSLTVGISVAVVGFGFIIWSLTRLSRRHKPFLTDLVIVLVITVIFIMVSSYYLDVKSFSDVRNGITGPFITENSSTPQQ